MSETEWTLEKILEREKFYAEGEKKLGKEGAYHTKLYEYLLKVQQDEAEIEKKEYRVVIKGEDDDGNIVSMTYFSDLSSQDMAAIFWCVFDDLLTVTGKSKEEIIDIFNDCYREPK